MGSRDSTSMPMDNSNNRPDLPGNQHDSADDNNIMVEDAVSNFTWELSRNGKAQQVNGAVLAVLVSVALENGGGISLRNPAPSELH